MTVFPGFPPRSRADGRPCRTFISLANSVSFVFVLYATEQMDFYLHNRQDATLKGRSGKEMVAP
jgi:hypothetical protein